MQQEDFVLTVRNWQNRNGLVHVVGRWDGGCCPRQGEKVIHEPSGLDIFVNHVAIGEGPLELVLMCGHVQPALRQLKVGDRIRATR